MKFHDRTKKFFVKDEDKFLILTRKKTPYNMFQKHPFYIKGNLYKNLSFYNHVDSQRTKNMAIKKIVGKNFEFSSLSSKLLDNKIHKIANIDKFDQFDKISKMYATFKNSIKTK